MNKQIFLVTLIIAAVLGLAAAGLVTEVHMANAQDMLTYENPTYGIKVQYPSNWIKEQSHKFTYSFQGAAVPTPVVIFTTPTGSTYANFNIEVGSGHNLSLDQYTDLSMYVLKSILKNKNITIATISSNRTTLAGVPAQKVVYDWLNPPASGQPDLRFMQVVAIKNNTAFVITYGTLPGDFFANGVSIANKMIDSFAFIPIRTTMQSTS
jgi:eukaryotic-like serine/threonine-protein kinase